MKLRFLPISHCKNYLSAVPMDFGAANRTLSLGRMSSCIFALWIRSSSLASPGRHRRSFRQQARFVRDEMKLRFLPISHCKNYLSAVPMDFGAANRTLSLGRMSTQRLVQEKENLFGVSCRRAAGLLPQGGQCEDVRVFPVFETPTIYPMTNGGNYSNVRAPAFLRKSSPRKPCYVFELASFSR